jgi:CheY-like chemotaxis protein
VSEPAARRRDPITGRVLIVDDQEANRLLLRDLLESQGHAVTEAIDGVEALQRVAEAAPDVVLLDVDAGPMASKCRRSSESATATIPPLVTALSQRDQRLLGIGAGANDYITKPIDKSDLSLRRATRFACAQLYGNRRSNIGVSKTGVTPRQPRAHDRARSPVALAGIRAYLDLMMMDGEGSRA